MLQQCFHILFISAICIIWGLPMVLIFRNQKKSEAISFEEIIFSFFTGLSILSLFAAWACLFFPLSYQLVLIGSLLPVLLLVFQNKKNRIKLPVITSLLKSTKIELIVFTILGAALFVILASNKPVMPDTDLYHLQIIRWNQEYGTVKGLANLYLRYGFYSNWLSLVSFFALPFKNLNYLYLNSCLSIWFLLFLVQKLSFHLQRFRNTKENKVFSFSYLIILVLLFVNWGLIRVNASSTSYDFIVSCLTIITLLSITEEIIIGSYLNTSRLYPLIIITVSIPFFKLSGIAILLILFTYFLVTRKKKTVYFITILLAIAFLIPFLARNYIETGYPLFPYTFLSLGNPDWQVPTQMADKIASYISLNNKYFNQPIPINEWKAPSYHWLKSWFKFIPRIDQLIILLLITGLPIFSFFRKTLLKGKERYLPIYVVDWLALIIWFLLSPDPRFAYGYLLIMVAIPWSFLAAKFFPAKFISLSIVVLSGGIIIYGTHKTNVNNVRVPEISTLPQISVVKINNTNYNIPVKQDANPDGRCFYSPLPCIYEINPYLELRGDNYKNGFRMSKTIDSVFIMNYSY
ncbi:MAG: hypothetical protein ABUT20_29015 [Bacteroidota bacterium]